jgi:hypothetical protein
MSRVYLVMIDSNLNNAMVPGVKVMLSGNFLKNTGQQCGGEGQSTWTIIECPCRSCKDGFLVAVNAEREWATYFTPEEVAEHPYLKQRHIAKSNLVIYGRPSLRNCC